MGLGRGAWDNDLSDEAHQRGLIGRVQGLEDFLFQLFNRGQGGQAHGVAFGRQGQFPCSAILLTHDSANPTFFHHAVNHAPNGGSVIADQFGDMGLIGAWVCMNGIKCSKLNWCQVKARCLRSLPKGGRGMLVEAADQMSRHVKYVHVPGPG